ncbi:MULTISPECIES: hypothetical protein [Sphingomonadaceae]|jgi:hypothetical protein|uniref:Uncharacterized protein n=3 Tax=Sphingomonadaceae TaxID=41297 RepID=A0A7X4GJT0_9SPHN|nr:MULTISPECIES: hypothetical protein [Sphingomonadaceae]MBU67468.1 hypothetical protein [Cupriavidus sp.]MCC4253843.1 hypothetical protein [Sphingobium naphthae]MDG5973079.1 hypothetical protein [Sphingomonas paucimobilis]MEA3482064.1 hypothetical protein [Pseudomonadota bacterium]OJY53945.1 MAG: hypothetical protein BGP17_15770 [Sphingomonas sp. 67-41]BBD03605.1 hypothetical protein YGS_C3P0128 [Sphingobium sp. YG1]|tara:strand:+ start:148 stop:486 length:339 start_codon:yes stop_codon:yes gene_type:complete
MKPFFPRTVPRKDKRPALGAVLFAALHACGLIATTLLLTWGLFILFFLAIGGFSFDGLMHQLANLASRYVAADPDRIANFRTVVLVSHLLLSGAVIVLRRHALLPKMEAYHG